MKGFIKINRSELDSLLRLGSSTLKLYLCLLARADYRTGIYQGTYRILMAETGLARSTLCGALRELRSENQTESVQDSNRSGLKIRLRAIPYTKEQKEQIHTPTENEFSGKPSENQLQLYALEQNFAADRVAAFWHHHTAYGWRSSYGNRIADWRSALHLWMAGKPSGKNRPATSPQRPIWTQCQARCRFWNKENTWCEKFIRTEPSMPDACRYF